MDHKFQLGSDHILSYRLFSLPLTHKGQLSATRKILHALSIGKEKSAQKQCNIFTGSAGSVVECLRPRGCGFEPRRRLCTVVLEQDTFILA